MKSRSRIIYTLLVNGVIDGPQILSLGLDSSCNMFVIPRADISDPEIMARLNRRPALYILSAPDRSRFYIGQTTNFPERKNEHLREKEWWTTACVVVCDSPKLYGDDIRYLEQMAISSAIAAGVNLDDSLENTLDPAIHSIATLDNGNIPARPAINYARACQLDRFFDDIRLLAVVAGFDIFCRHEDKVETVPAASPCIASSSRQAENDPSAAADVSHDPKAADIEIPAASPAAYLSLPPQPPPQHVQPVPALSVTVSASARAPPRHDAKKDGPQNGNRPYMRRMLTLG